MLVVPLTFRLAGAFLTQELPGGRDRHVLLWRPVRLPYGLAGVDGQHGLPGHW